MQIPAPVVFKRFWSPIETPLELSDGGFLPDPEQDWSRYFNTAIQGFDSIAQAPCLVLFGEPGSGKSHSIKEAYENRVGVAERETRLFRNLGSYGNEIRLINDVFKGPEIEAWLDDDGQRLHMFLDSLDECKLMLKHVGAILAEEIPKLPVHRLCVRIACRSAEWPEVLGTALTSLWPQGLQRYELAPLRRIDVREAATAHKISADDFLSEVCSRDVVPLAIRPLTLSFLLRTYKKSRSLPRTKAELYEKGCRYLCEEPSAARRDMREVGQHSADEHLAVATRIAALMAFGNRTAIWVGPDESLSLSTDILLADFVGGTEKANQKEVPISQTAVHETLNKALFVGRGQHRFGWVHQSYGEYLAARFVRERGLSIRQTLSLQTDSADGRVVPQLREVAAWTASLVPEVFRALMIQEAELLLSGDVENADPADRSALVQTLLHQFDRHELDNRVEYWHAFRKLRHPGLAEQLRPFIVTPGRGPMVRSVAIKMAGKCEVKSLQDALVAVALDATEPVFLRVDALYALRSIADQSSHPQLKPLLSLGASEDPDDQIKGCVLDLVWPNHIVLNELFASLSSPRRPELYGAYRAFLGRLKDDLKPEQLSTALEWIKSRTGQIDGLTDIDNAIIALGCKSIRLPGIAPLLAACLAPRMNDHHVDWQNQHETSSIRSVMATDVEGRRLLLQSLAPLLSKFGQLELLTVGFVLTEDFAWVLDQIVQNSQVADKNLWCQIAGRLFDTTNSLHLDHIFAASQRDTTVASQFEWLLYPVPLDSPLADQMRQGYHDRMDLEVKRAEYANYKVEPPPEARIKNRLEQFEGGEMAAFWWLTQEMTLKPDSRIYESTSKSDVTGFPGWIDADCETRMRVLRAAKDYILYGDPENRAWLGTDRFNCTALAGFRAMRLVYKREPAWLDACGAEVWQKWTAILLTYFTTSGQGVEDREALVRRAYESAPDEVLSVLQQMIDVECAKHSRPFIVRHVEHCWDKRLESTLLDKVAEPNLSASCIAYLLDRLMAHGSVAAEKYALSLLNPIPARSHSGWRRSVGAGAILTIYADGAIWDKIWRAIRSNVEFGREMVSQIGSYSELGEIGIGPGLSEQQLADFFIWLEREFPYSEDPSVGGDGWTTPRGSVAQLRSGVLYRLRRLGTPQSCTELRRIAQECPALDWMKGIIQEAETTTREKTWVPPIPSEVLALAQNQSARLVTDGSQLLEVLLESLQKIEEKIGGETREVHLLWDRLREGTYRPKDENILSDYLKNRLDDLHRRGVIVNREVEIHRPEQGKPGQRTDIHIDAVSPRSNSPEYDRITVILEAKGCWHRDLQVAMKTQLVDRYLKDNRSKCGLYLVGWYSCDKWDTEHYQRKDAERWGWSLREAREYFTKQAAELSVDGLLIKAFVLNLALPQKS